MKIGRINGDITINGVKYSGDNMSYENGVFNVGDAVIDIAPNFNITIHGDVQSITNTHGFVSVLGNVTGDVKTTNGDVQVDGSTGNVSSVNGKIKCGPVTGSVSTINGDIFK